MELILNAADLAVLKTAGKLPDIIDLCSNTNVNTATEVQAVEGQAVEEQAAEQPAPAEEKKAKKKTAKKKEETPVKEESPAAGPEPELTHESVSQKAIPLVKAGRSEELSALLTSYGVQAIPQLAGDQLAGFYQDLVRMGA